MSVREIVGRLADAKRQIEQVKVMASQSAASITEASALVQRVLDDVQAKTLSTSISGHAQGLTAKANDVVGLSRGLDLAIQRHRAIGGR